MQKPPSVAVIIVLPLVLILVPALEAQENWLANSCAVTGDSPASGNKTSKIGGLLRKVRENSELLALAGVLLDESSICSARTQEEVLLLTGVMMDRTALAAALGVDAAQEALGRKRTLQEKLAELDRALHGLGSGPTAFGSGDSNATQVLVQEVADESQALAVALQQLKDSKALDAQALAKLAEAQRNLSEVSYYGVNGAAGGTVFGRFWSSNQSKANVTAMLQRIGFKSDFAERLPDRARDLPNTFKNTILLKSTIATVVADPEKEADEGEKRAKKHAQEDANAVRAGIKSLGMATTPR